MVEYHLTLQKEFLSEMNSSSTTTQIYVYLVSWDTESTEGTQCWLSAWQDSGKWSSTF